MFEKEKINQDNVANTSTTTVVCANGNHRSSSDVASTGAAYAAYEVMKLIGFAFMHPLAPIKPNALNFTAVLQINKTYADVGKSPTGLTMIIEKLIK
tara:strand:+ start:208 stop:498 length:291 start_codon:yes stop_codon:yes gene_type:complete